MNCLKTTARSLASRAVLQLKDSIVFEGRNFGANVACAGEVVFTTSLVGYPESMTDPSYHGQILVFTQPLIGNYGVPAMSKDRFGLFEHFESGKIQTKGIIVNDYAAKYSHWTAVESLGAWCKREGIPALTGVDTRALVSLLRNNGSTLGRISQNNQNVEYPNYSGVNMVEQVSSLKQQVFNKDGKLHVALLDCGAKQNIIRCLAKRNVKVTTFPWNYDVSKHLASFDGLFISNGPGDPQNCQQTITNIRKVYDLQRTSSNPVPIFGICMGHQLMGLAAGFEAYKLPFGNRGHNQPALNLITGNCLMTSQNHGYALNDTSLPSGWKPFFRNVNDGSNEGIKHTQMPYMSVQFHPEAMGGPQDTEYLFEEFLDMCNTHKFAKSRDLYASERMAFVGRRKKSVVGVGGVVGRMEPVYV